MSEQDRQDQTGEQDRPEPDQHDPTTEEDTSSGGAPEEADSPL